jgi:hypothetical protein
MERELFVGENRSSYKKAIIAVIALLGLVGVVAVIALTTGGQTDYASTQLALQHHEFRQFIEKYNKFYEDEEEYGKRFEIYRENSALIRAHNRSPASYTLEVNMFADMTHEEFTHHYTATFIKASGRETTVFDTVGLPTSVDWVEKGAVTPVKN